MITPLDTHTAPDAVTHNFSSFCGMRADLILVASRASEMLLITMKRSAIKMMNTYL